MNIIKRKGLEIRLLEEKPDYKLAHIKPKGFWSDVVTIRQDWDLRQRMLEEPIITWAGGGQDGTLSNIEVINSFITALEEAKRIANLWNQNKSYLKEHKNE